MSPESSLSSASHSLDANPLPPSAVMMPDAEGRSAPPSIAVHGAKKSHVHARHLGRGRGTAADSVLLPAPAGTPPALPRAESDDTLDRVLMQQHHQGTAQRAPPHSYHGLAQGAILW